MRIFSLVALAVLMSCVPALASKCTYDLGETTSRSHPSESLAADLIPKGWTVVEDVAPRQFETRKLKPRSFMNRGDWSAISNSEMRKRAAKFKCNLGLVDAKRMLADRGKLIPVDFRGLYIALPGTVMRGLDGCLHTGYLFFSANRWVLSFDWITSDWNGSDRLACSK